MRGFCLEQQDGMQEYFMFTWSLESGNVIMDSFARGLLSKNRDNKGSENLVNGTDDCPIRAY